MHRCNRLRMIQATDEEENSHMISSLRTCFTYPNHLEVAETIEREEGENP